MKKFNSFALVLSKILEVLHWIGSASMVVLMIVSIFASKWLNSFVSQNISQFEGSLSTYGLEMTIVNADGNIIPSAIMLFSIGAIFILSLMAMVFRNSYLILKTAKGKTWFAKGTTPFQKDITRMMREIGIFCISVPIVGLIINIIGSVVVGTDVFEGSVRIENTVIGILVLCLSQAFVYGTQLQDDVDGLL